MENLLNFYAELENPNSNINNNNNNNISKTQKQKVARHKKPMHQKALSVNKGIEMGDHNINAVFNSTKELIEKKAREGDPD